MGPYHYLPSLGPGAHELRVSLNDNSHNELTWQGRPLEATTTVIVPEAAAMNAHDSTDHLRDLVDVESFMGLNIVAHADALGGYNLEVEPMGFRFTQAVGEPSEPGEGYAVVGINGEVFNRLYVPWLQVPAQGAGTHTFTVALINSEGNAIQVTMASQLKHQFKSTRKERRRIPRTPRQITMAAVPPSRLPRTMTATPIVRAAATTAKALPVNRPRR